MCMYLLITPLAGRLYWLQSWLLLGAVASVAVVVAAAVVVASACAAVSAPVAVSKPVR